MKKMIVISFLLFIFLVNPASADLFNDMNQKVVVYNQNVDKVPDFVKSLLGNEEIYGIVELNDGSLLEVKVVTKDSRVVVFQKLGTRIAADKGDCNKDGDLTAVDALCALEMSVGKMEEDEGIDVDESGEVTSLDAKIILQSAVGLSPEVDPTIVVSSDESTIRSIMESKTPIDTFLDAYDSGAIEIEPVGVVRSITFLIGEIALKIARLVGAI